MRCLLHLLILAIVVASRATLLGTAWRAALTCQAREVDHLCVDAVDIVVAAAVASVAVVEAFVAGAEAANTLAAALVAVSSLLLFANYLCFMYSLYLFQRPERATSAARRVISNATALSGRCLVAELQEEDLPEEDLPEEELPEAEL